MTLHHQPVSALICHRCDHREPYPQHCPSCQSTKLQSLGAGTEQIEQFIKATFPATPCIRVDRDSTQGRNSFSDKLAQLKDAEPAILVGTQMITKGHHLPNISLVVALNVDSALYSHDFRALEHLTQSLIQVAGRSGRGDSSGKILIETAEPDHPIFDMLADCSYQKIANSIIQRRKTQNLPPFCYSALIHANSIDLQLVQTFMAQCYAQLKPLEIDCIGPMPSSIERKNNRYRLQIQLYADKRADLHNALASVEVFVAKMQGLSKIRWGIDVDPLAMD